MLSSTPAVRLRRGVSPAAGNRLIPTDPDGVVYADDGVELRRSQAASVQMDDAPSEPTTSSTVMVSLWQRNFTAVKALRHVTWIKRADAVALVNLT